MIKMEHFESVFKMNQFIREQNLSRNDIISIQWVGKTDKQPYPGQVLQEEYELLYWKEVHYPGDY